MPDVESGKIKIVTIATYDNPSYVKESDTVYFVIEGATASQKYLSLYVGTDKQTDILNIQDLVSAGIVVDPEELPPGIIKIKDKLYYIEDTDLNVFRAYIKSNNSNELIPLYGTPIWETLT